MTKYDAREEVTKKRKKKDLQKTKQKTNERNKDSDWISGLKLKVAITHVCLSRRRSYQTHETK